ncbi:MULTISPECIES: Spy/CpxP family protein refolding chaperone [unclassified Sulfurospirillum]|uniref:Spy/CpxP family protein refolding chaperone n=1 Tax=Sulfurospirillum sp. UCH001 TaxID=1581011 RepID=UPI0008338825|nr:MULTISPECIES: Spy/CpxP family protein refolding chaperone [unclassified Sulfurospirillum]WNY98224.1 Spy/CpxP family protein refolding chaperone [Sulfurospirillum sp. 'SP']
MKKTILTLATLVALGTTSAFAFGGGQCQNMQSGMGMMQGGCGMGGSGMMMGGKGGMMPQLMQLNLTDDQRHKLAVLQSEMKLEMTKIRDPKMMTKMQDLMSADSFNKKEFIKIHNEMHEKMLALQADHMEKVFNLLTKEQRAELKTLMAQKPQKPMPMAPAAAPSSK